MGIRLTLGPRLSDKLGRPEEELPGRVLEEDDGKGEGIVGRLDEEVAGSPAAPTAPPSPPPNKPPRESAGIRFRIMRLTSA